MTFGPRGEPHVLVLGWGVQRSAGRELDGKPWSEGRRRGANTLNPLDAIRAMSSPVGAFGVENQVTRAGSAE